VNPFRPSVRLKLTLLYGALFVIAGLFLIAVAYGLVWRELRPAVPIPISRVLQEGPDRRDENLEARVRRAFREERADALRQFRRQSLIALAIATAGALGLGWILAGQVLRPIRQITSHAKASSATTLSERIHLEGPEDELKELADTFDAMLDRLQAAFQAQQSFGAQISHELRTPLAIIRAEAEVAQASPDASARERESANAILTAVQRSERLVDALLALARSESTMLNMEPVDLADLAGDVVGEYVGEADEAAVRLDLALESARVRGDPPLLSRMIGNLVQNAIRYNVASGSVAVSVRPESGSAVLTVENGGPHVNQQQIDDLFKPFVRGQWAHRNRTGFGLGLAIVQAVATAHQGNVQAIPGALGGLRVVVQIPLFDSD
jgi:signal transduction histidine kinase